MGVGWRGGGVEQKRSAKPPEWAQLCYRSYSTGSRSANSCGVSVPTLSVMLLRPGGCSKGFGVYVSHLKYAFNCAQIKRSCHLFTYSYQWRLLFKLKVVLVQKNEYWISHNSFNLELSKQEVVVSVKWGFKTLLHTNLIKQSAAHNLSFSLTVSFWENPCYFKANCVLQSCPLWLSHFSLLPSPSLPPHGKIPDIQAFLFLVDLECIYLW